MNEHQLLNVHITPISFEFYKGVTAECSCGQPYESLVPGTAREHDAWLSLWFVEHAGVDLTPFYSATEEEPDG